MIVEATKQISEGQSLSQEQMTEVFDSIMKGDGSDAKIKAFLIALHQKGETVDELAGAAAALRKHMTPIRTRRENCVDTCGTGGANSGTFNISTAAAIVAASAGASVAKHGNRRSTSSSGSADVLAELGVKVDCTVEVTQKCLDQLGLCFCFAPLFHPSVKKVMKVRKSLDHPTIFNLIGPLCNPASAPYQILGAGRPETRELIARALAKLGTERALVVHSRDGLGEISIAETTDVSEVRKTFVTEGTLTPNDFRLEQSTLMMVKAGDPKESAEIIQRVLGKQGGAARDIVVANAAAALWISGLCDNLEIGAERCATAIDNGQAAEMLKDLVEMTNKGR